MEYYHQGSRSELLAGGSDGVHALGLAKSAQEAFVGPGGPAEHKQFGEDDSPGEQRKQQQHGHHRDGDWLSALDYLPKINLRYDADPVFRNQPVPFLVPLYIVSNFDPVKQKMFKMFSARQGSASL